MGPRPVKFEFAMDDITDSYGSGFAAILTGACVFWGSKFIIWRVNLTAVIPFICPPAVFLEKDSLAGGNVQF